MQEAECTAPEPTQLGVWVDEQMEKSRCSSTLQVLILPFPWIYPDGCRMDPAGPLLAQVGVLNSQGVSMSPKDTTPFSLPFPPEKTSRFSSRNTWRTRTRMKPQPGKP